MLDFWKRMAASQWANHPQVMFELWNESEDIGAHRGGPGSWADQKPTIQETIDAIRAAGARNIVIVPTPFYSTWAGEATASPLSGPNIAYAVHQYREQWEAYPANREQIMKGLASGQPIVVTEWGDNTAETDPAKMWPSVTTAPPALRALLEPGDGAQHPAAGWFAWALSQSWQPPLFRNDALTSPTPFGVATRQWLFEKRNEAAASAAGTPRRALWPPHLLVVTLVGALVTAGWVRRRVTSPVPAPPPALTAALARSDSVAPSNRKFGSGLRDRLGRATRTQRHRRPQHVRPFLQCGERIHLCSEVHRHTKNLPAARANRDARGW